MNKEIEEMEIDLAESCVEVLSSYTNEPIVDIRATAENMANKGYCKSTEGVWVDQYEGKYANALYKCSVCGEPAYGNGKVWFFSKFCPSCGAKMKGANDEV